MDGQASTISTAINRPASYRWLQLFMGIVCMAMIANLKYGWTLFVNPISEKYGWTRAAIQIAFTIFVLTETWLVPFEGYLVDKYGPRPVVLVGGLLCGIRDQGWRAWRAGLRRAGEGIALPHSQSYFVHQPVHGLGLLRRRRHRVRHDAECLSY